MQEIIRVSDVEKYYGNGWYAVRLRYPNPFF